MADAFGHLAGVRRRGAHPFERHAQLVGDDLRHLGVQALSHLGAAVVHLHAAVGVHVDQGARLVEEGGGEADAELHRRDGDAALDHGARGVPRRDGFAPLPILAVALQLRDQRLQDVVLDLHLVVGDVAVFHAVEVAQAHVQRIQAEPARDVAQDGLDHDHALRPAEAPEGGVALRVGLATVGRDLDVAQEIRVVGVEDRPVGHRPGQVGRETAVGQHGELERGDQAGIVEAHAVVIGERVALAGDHEVVVAVQPQLDRVLALARGQGRPYGQVAGLGFLAAEAAAHAPALHRDGVVLQSQRMRHPVLDLARMLGAGIDPPLVLLQRQGIGDLALQVEMLLAADFELPVQAVRRARQRRFGLAAAHGHRRQHIALEGMRFARRQHGRQRLDIELHLARGAAGLHDRVGDDHAHHLADDAPPCPRRRWARRGQRWRASRRLECPAPAPRPARRAWPAPRGYPRRAGGHGRRSKEWAPRAASPSPRGCHRHRSRFRQRGRGRFHGGAKRPPPGRARAWRAATSYRARSCVRPHRPRRRARRRCGR